MKTIMYLFSEARKGLLSNIPAVTAAVLIIFISISVLGVSFLVKKSLDYTIDYLNDQVKIRVMIDPEWNTSEVAAVLHENVLIKNVQVETKEQMVESMGNLFEEQSELLEMFNFSSLPDAITIELKDSSKVEQVAGSLKNTEGITDVIYPGEYVASVIQWADRVQKYSFISIFVLILASVLTVMMTINLALYKRKKEVRVKLLIGAKPSHVRTQFLIEGGIIGMLGGILANYVIYFVSENILQLFYIQLPYVFKEQEPNLPLVFSLSIGGGLLLGLIGSYMSTYKVMKYE